MIHPKSSYVIEDSRHAYGPSKHRINETLTLRVGDRAGTWCGYYAYGGHFELVGISFGLPPARLYVPATTRWEILRSCFTEDERYIQTKLTGIDYE